jgi:hypothetical protein
MLTTPDPKLWRDWAFKARVLSRRIEPAMQKLLEEIAERCDLLAEISSLTPPPPKKMARRRGSRDAG